MESLKLVLIAITSILVETDGSWNLEEPALRYCLYYPNKTLVTQISNLKPTEVQ